VEINELNSYSLFCKINPQYFNFKYDYSKDYCYEKEDLNPYLIEYDNFQYFEKQPNFHLFNYLILLTNILLGIFLFARKKILRKVIVFDQVKDT